MNDALLRVDILGKSQKSVAAGKSPVQLFYVIYVIRESHARFERAHNAGVTAS